MKAYVDGGALTATGDDVSVRAIATSTAEPSVEGISRGLVAVGSMNSNASIGGATQAYIAGTTSVDASRLEIAANDISSAKPITVIGGGGGLAISSSESVLEITRVTEAVIQGGADLTLISGGVDVTATSQTDGSSETTSVTVALVSIGIVTVESAVNNTTRSKIQSGATVRVPLGSVNVTTGAANTASSKIKSTSVGFVTATNSTPVAKVTSTTDASSTGQIIGLTRDSVAGNVTISATATDISVAGAETVGGGAIKVTTTNVTAETASTVNASAGGRILSGGNLTVLAVSTSDADARTESIGGGAVDITTLNATATANPDASVHVTSGSELLVTGTVTMRASAGEDPPVFADGTFQAGSAVDTVANSIRFNGNHGLVSGDTVTYNTEGQVAIGGMTNGRLYGVLNVAGSSDTLRLGVIVRSNNIDPAQTPLIDLDRDTIRFSGTHSLQDGDRVIYERGAGAIIGGLIDDKVYSVRRIDAQTIKLVDPDVTLKPPKDFTGANIQGNILTIAGHGFADNDAVTYRGPKASGFTLNQVEANGDALDSIRIEGHSFVAGDEVIYSAGDAAILGLSDGGRYFVIVDSADSVRLAATSDEATGANGATITAIEIGNPSKASLTALHSLRKVTDQLIGGLQEGVTYYVGRIDADSFRLRDRSGQIVTLGGKDGVSGTVLSGAHTLAQEGVDLTAIGSELHSLVIDLSGGGSGTQTLEGVGGALALIRGNATGMVTAAASGTGGGVVRVAGAETEAEASPTVSVMFGSDVYMLAGSIDIESLAKANVTSTAASSGGGLVSVGSSMASAITDATSTITIDGARLEAIGKIDLDA
ncbi:MAG: beta strand repeat-containing protein, partial [Pirellulaceae bacterium]